MEYWLIFRKLKYQALAMDGFELRGRYIEVKEPRGRRKAHTDLNSLKMKIKEGVKTIFVNNLPYDISEQEIGDNFRACGKIENIRMVYNTSKGHFKGLVLLVYIFYSVLISWLS